MFTNVQDYIALTKPRITLFCLIMTVCGACLVSNNFSLFLLFMALLGTALSVGSANAFNMIYEQDVDKLMERTCKRPIASGRLKISHATIFAFFLGLLSIIVLAVFVNFMTALIALMAIVFYSIVYTPLKVKTPLALVIGAIPGAVAPLLGATAVLNQVTLIAFIAFSILFAWQMPHFIAISIYLKKDYEKAGIKVVSVVRSAKATRIQAVLWTFVLLIISLLPYPLHFVGKVYLICTSLIGLYFFVVSIQGLTHLSNTKWPRRFFLVSLVYLPLLAFSVFVDRIILLR